jgi:hypothetical protein
MDERNLSYETEEFLNGLVERVARKAGYLDVMSGNYKDYLENMIIQKRNQLEKKIAKKSSKVRLKPHQMPFHEEIKTYFRDNIRALFNEGHSEETAVRIVNSKLEQAEVTPDFESFAERLDGFWTQEYSGWENMQAQRGELEGLFYIAFLVTGITAGSFLGYLLGETLRDVVIGLAVGIGTGMSLGLFTHAFIRWRRG